MQKIILYQIFTRLFGNTNRNQIKYGNLQQNGCGKFNDFTDLALEEIKKLGCTHIWYTGVIEHATCTDYSNYGITKDSPDVVKGIAGSPYAIKDYYDVCPDLAENVPNRMQEFEALIDRTKKNGLKTIIDFVPNHLARNYVSDSKPDGVKDFGCDDKKDVNFDIHNNYYYLPNESFEGPVKATGQIWNEFPARVTGNDCISSKPNINDWYETVKLNYGIDIFNNNKRNFYPTPDTWHKMLDILLYWASKNIDGFRCDMAEMVPFEFWGWVIPRVKKEYPHIIFIAEVYNPALYRDYINVGKFDYLYDKVGLYDTLKVIIQGFRSASDITQIWESLQGIHHNMLFFLENHDEQRIASPFFAGDANKAIPMMVVSGALNSNPLMIYFGQELGEEGMDEEGFSGKDGRTTIFDYWGVKRYQDWVNNGKFDGALLDDNTKNLRNWYRKLLHILNDYEAIYNGSFYDLMWANNDNPKFDSKNLFSFLRYTDNQIILIVVNFSSVNFNCRVKIPKHAFNLLRVKDSKFMKGYDLLNDSNKISFPQEVAITNGIGIKIKGLGASMYLIS